MTDREKQNFHIFFAFFFIILFSTFESSLWHDLFSPMPNPQLWLSVAVYFFLYRTRMESLLVIYIPSLFIFSQTMQPLGFLLLAQTFVLLLNSFIKGRVFIPGSFYYGVLYSTSVLFFHIFLFIFSWLFEIKMTSYPQVWKWIVQAIIAFILSPLVFSIYEKVFPQVETSSDGVNS